MGIISSRNFPVKHPSVKFRDSIHRHPPVSGVFKSLSTTSLWRLIREDSPGPNDGTVVEGAACTLLAQSFAALLTDRKRRFAASLDYTKPVKRLGFLAGFRLYFRIKAKFRGLTDDELHARILKTLADPESENNDNQ